MKEIRCKKKWETPNIIDLDIENTESGANNATFEGAGTNGRSYTCPTCS